jgi:hypothetical protein
VIELIYDPVKLGFAFGVRRSVAALAAGIKLFGLIIAMFPAFGAFAVFDAIFPFVFSHVISPANEYLLRKYIASHINKS